MTPGLIQQGFVTDGLDPFQLAEQRIRVMNIRESLPNFDYDEYQPPKEDKKFVKLV